MSKAKTYRDSLYGRPNTVKTKLSMFNNHIAPFSTTARDPDDVVHQCIKSWKEDDLSLGTIKLCFVVLGEYMKMTYGIELDKKRLMFQHFEDTPRPQTKVKAWSPKETNIVLALPVAYPTDKYVQWQMIQTYLNTGLRKGELLGLVWADIDFLNGVIRVQRSKDFATSRVGPTKTKKFRTVPMNKEVEDILTMRYNVGVAEVEFVFPHVDVNETLEWLCHHAKVTKITTHGLRHTFATTLLEKGISPKYVSELLGHDKLSTTLDIYWSYLPSRHKLEDIYGNT
jgi:integrase